MRKLKIFEVVKLKDGKYATIVAVNRNEYKGQITNEKGETEGIKNIIEEEIEEIVVSK